MSDWVLYQCLGRCKRKFLAMAPSGARFATGSPVKCCGKVAEYIRPATEEEAKNREAGVFKPYVVESKREKEYENPYAHLGVGRRFKK